MDSNNFRILLQINFRKKRRASWRGLLVKLLMMTTLVCSWTPAQAYDTTGVIGADSGSGATQQGGEIASGNFHVPSQIAWCETSFNSEPALEAISISFTSGNSISSGSTSGASCGSIDITSTMHFTNMCYSLTSDGYIGIFRLDYDGGSINIGQTTVDSATCTNLALPGPLKGLKYLNGGTIIDQIELFYDGTPTCDYIVLLDFSAAVISFDYLVTQTVNEAIVSSNSAPAAWSLTCDLVVTSSDSSLVTVSNEVITVTTNDDSKAGLHTITLTASAPFGNTLEFDIDIKICVYPVFAESTWATGTTLDFDLLSQFSETVALPDSTIATTECYEYSIAWSVHKASDDSDVSSTNLYIDPSNQVDLTVQILTDGQTLADQVTQRKALYDTQGAGGPDNYYFLGTTTKISGDLEIGTTTKKYFTINFTDACRTATINSQTDSLPVDWIVNWSWENSEFVQEAFMNSFTDSVDSGGQYDLGVCGEKQMTLDAGTPSYLQMWYYVDYRRQYFSETLVDVEQRLDNLYVRWAQADSAESDLGEYTISYTVAHKEYSDLTSSIADSFTFEMKCSSKFGQAGYSAPTIAIELLNSSADSIQIPSLDQIFTSCYTNIDWSIYKKSSDLLVVDANPVQFSFGPSDVGISYTLSDIPTRLQTYTDHEHLVTTDGVEQNEPQTEYYLMGTVTLPDSSTSNTEEFAFTITFNDACRSSTVVAQSFAEFPVQWQTDATASLTVAAFTDSIDESGSYSTGICGEKRLTLDAGSPVYLSVTHSTDEPALDSFTIDYVESPGVTEDLVGQVYTISYTVQNVDYDQITSSLADTFAIEIKCSQTYTEDAFSLTSIDFDLLLQEETFTLPTISDIPLQCFTIAWDVWKKFDDSNMVTLYPSVFSISETEMTLSHLTSDFATRAALFGTDDYRFRGTLTGSNDPNTPTNNFEFQINFTDACRSATIVSQPSITLTNPTWLSGSQTITTIQAFTDSIDSSSTYQVGIFTDSVDSSSTYQVGICGEKRLTLDAGSPAFLSIAYGSDPVLDSLTIEYNESDATEDDVNVEYTVSYTVRSVEYPDLIPDETGSFTVKILCPSTYTEDAYSSQLDFELLDGTAAFPLPTLSNIPSQCFTVTWNIYRDSDGENVASSWPDIYKIENSELVLTHDISNFDQRADLFGAVLFYFRGTVDGESTPTTPTNNIEFTINFTDACRAATIQSSTIVYPSPEWLAGDDSLDVTAFTDSVDGGASYAQGICGEKRLTLVEADAANPVPTFLSVAYSAVDPVLEAFTINYTESLATTDDVNQVFTVGFSVTMVKYQGVTLDLTGTFEFQIACPSTFSEDSFTPDVLTLDLVGSETVTLAVPSISNVPTQCFSITWSMHRKSDELDMVVQYPTEFTMSQTELTINAPATSDFATRLALYGLTDYLFRAAVSGDFNPATPISDFEFQIDFTDSCRTATIIDASVDYPVQTWKDGSYIHTIPAFTDSMDSVGLGICGEKTFTLDSGSPAHLNVAYSTDPVFGDIKIYYEESDATNDDVGLPVTVSYTVTMKEYADATNDLTSSFEFEITCSDWFVEDPYSHASLDGNLLEDFTLQVTLPTVSDIPSICQYTLTWSVVRDSDSLAMEVEYPTIFVFAQTELIISHTASNIDHRLQLFGSSFKFFGTLTVAGVDPVVTQGKAFELNFSDSCRSATIVHQGINFPILNWSQDTNFLQMAAYTDSIDADRADVGWCGEKRLTLDVGSPGFLSITYGPDPLTDNFVINYDKSQAVYEDANKEHVVSYTVTIFKYNGITEDITDTFTVRFDCPSTYTEENFDSTRMTFNLLFDSQTKDLPTISDIPPECYELTWHLYRRKASEEESMLTDFSSVFAIDATGTHLTMNHPDQRDYVTRLDLFGEDAEWIYFFRGDVTGIKNPTTPTSEFQFMITFQDECRSSVINSQDLIEQYNTENLVIWKVVDSDQTFVVPAFTDTIDDLNNADYGQGVCGEKRLTLDAGGLAYLSMTYDEDDRVLGSACLDYDESMAFEADVQDPKTVQYTVTNVDYESTGQIQPITGSITFTITCPSTYRQDYYGVNTVDFDMHTRSKEVVLPTISEIPSQCHTLVWTVMSYGIDLKEEYPTFFVIDDAVNDKMTLTHLITDFEERITIFDLAGTYTFKGTITGERIGTTDEPEEIIESPEFTLTYIDSCRTATINHQAINFPDIIYLKEDFTELVLDAYTDQIDDAKDPTDATSYCGQKLLSFDLTQSFLSRDNGGDATSQVTISYDEPAVQHEEVDAMHTIAYTISYKEYSDVETVFQLVDQFFQFYIHCPEVYEMTIDVLEAEIDMLAKADQTAQRYLELVLPAINPNVPTQCYSISWLLERNQQDMIALYPSNYFITADSLSLALQAPDLTDFERRISLFGKDIGDNFGHILTATLTGPMVTGDETTKVFDLILKFLDSCQDEESFQIVAGDTGATFTYEGINTEYPTWDFGSDTLIVNAYSDTVDQQSQEYDLGVCGEKKLLLDADTTPDYLNVGYGDEVFIDDINIYYVETMATDDDVNVPQTIAYSVCLKEYPNMSAVCINESFEFLIQCSHLYVQDAYSPAAQTVDLLTDFSITFDLPTVSDIPQHCNYELVFSIMRNSDNVAMEVDFASFFALSDSEVTITHTLTDIAQRFELFDTSYRLAGTVKIEDQDAQELLDSPFEVFFEDVCRTSTIVEQALTVPTVIYFTDTVEVQHIDAFRDTLDDEGTYAVGICGEKRFALDEGSPAFLSLTYAGSDPILDQIIINYDEAEVTEFDVNVIHTVSYTVTNVSYPEDLVAPIHGTFTIEIKCPSTYTEEDYTPVEMIVDLLPSLLLAQSTQDLPVFSNIPEKCYTVTWSIYRKSDDANMETLHPKIFTIGPAVSFRGIDLLSSIATLGGGLSKLESGEPVQAADPTAEEEAAASDGDFKLVCTAPSADDYAARLSLFGSDEYYLQGVVVGPENPTTPTSRFDLTIQFQDTCRTAVAVEQEFEIEYPLWHRDASLIYSLLAFQDSVDGGNYQLGVCGEKVVTISADTPYLEAELNQTEPIVGDFALNYMMDQVSDADVGVVQTVQYTVELMRYVGIATPQTFTMPFEIICHFAEDPFNPSTVKFDLAYDYAQSHNFQLPLLSNIPVTNCPYSVSWNIYRLRDGQDMVELLPEVFTMGPTQLAMLLTPRHFDVRLALYGEEFYFRGSVKFDHYDEAQYTSDYMVAVEFSDVCRQALIFDREIETMSVIWSVDDQVSLNVPAFRDSEDVVPASIIGKCGQKKIEIDFSQTPFMSMSIGSDPVLDDFTITYNKAQATVDDVGLHEIQYTISLKEYADLAFSFQGLFYVEITETEYISFDQKIQSVALWPGQPKYWSLPLVDEDGKYPLDTITVEISPEITRFVSYDSDTQTFAFDGAGYAQLASHLGLSYQIFISLSDINGIEQAYEQTIEFVVNPFIAQPVEEEPVWVIDNQSQDEPTSDKDSVVDGNIETGEGQSSELEESDLFNQQFESVYQAIIETPVEELDEEQVFESIPLDSWIKSGVQNVRSLAQKQTELITQQAATSPNENRPPEARLSQFSNEGTLRIDLSSDFQFDSELVEEINNSQPENRRRLLEESQDYAITVQVVNSYFDEQEVDEQEQNLGDDSLLADWDLVSLDTGSFEIKCEFNNPMQISQGQEPDLVFIQLELSKFEASDGQRLPPSVIKYLEIPRQVSSQSEVDAVEGMSAFFATVTEMLLFGKALTGLMFAGPMIQVWRLLNGLQIMSYLPLYDVKVPGNVSSFNRSFKRIADLDVFDMKSATENEAYYPESEPLSLNFQDQGLNTVFILPNLATIFYIIICFLCIVFTQALLYLAGKFCIKLRIVSEKLGKVLYWNGLIRFFMLAFLDLCVCTLLHLKEMKVQDDFGSIQFNNAFAMISITVLVVLPAFLIVFYARNAIKWGDETFKKKHGTVTDGINTKFEKRKWLVNFVPLSFFVRRFIFALTIVFWYQFFWAQIALQFLMTTIMIIFLQWVRPFKSKKATWMETMNEVSTMVSLYFMLGFSDFIEQPQDRSNLGWLFICLFCIFITIHVSIMAHEIFHQIRLKLLIWKSQGKSLKSFFTSLKPTKLPKSGYKYEENPIHFIKDHQKDDALKLESIVEESYESGSYDSESSGSSEEEEDKAENKLEISDNDVALNAKIAEYTEQQQRSSNDPAATGPSQIIMLRKVDKDNEDDIEYAINDIFEDSEEFKSVDSNAPNHPHLEQQQQITPNEQSQQLQRINGLSKIDEEAPSWLLSSKNSVEDIYNRSEEDEQAQSYIGARTTKARRANNNAPDWLLSPKAHTGYGNTISDFHSQI